MKNLKLKLFTGLIGLSSIGMAQAATSTANMEVSTTVTASCTVTATNVAFSTFTPTANSGELHATATITPTCTKGSSYSIALNGGSNYNLGRQMKHTTSAEYISYVIGVNGTTMDFTPDATAFSGVGDGYGGAVQNYTVDAYIPTNVNVISGDYFDTLTITVTY